MRLPSVSLPRAIIIGSAIVGAAVLASATILASALPHYVPVAQQGGVMFRMNQADGGIEICSYGPKPDGTKGYSCSSQLTP